MKKAYPVILSQGSSHIVVTIPDFNINTQGKDTAEAIFMARDAIGLMGIDLQDDGVSIPEPSPINKVEKLFAEDIITLVDIDFDEYRKRHDNRTVRRNVSLPSWLDDQAARAGINVSAVLQSALKSELHINR